MGFLAYDFEQAGLAYPRGISLCTSLLARKLIPESVNHKLQTLVKFLKLEGGQAHRGLDDARACMQVGQICFDRLAKNLNLADSTILKGENLTRAQGKNLLWQNFTLQSADSKVQAVVAALSLKKDLEIQYSGGSKVGLRCITPLGIVRNPDGDFIQAICHLDHASKRFYFEKIESLRAVNSN
jgi:DNA polymerase-3 subunit epsilon